MATTAMPTLDIAALLAGIPGGDPAGEDIRYGVEHDQIKEARREDADLPQGVWKADRKRSEWAEVIRLSCAVLADRSKDIQVAAWLCEALLGRYGVPGLVSGLGLLSDLITTFGGDVHPRPDEDGDQSRRSLIFEWLNDRLVIQILTLPVTAPPGDRDTGLTFADFLNGQRLQAVNGRENRPAQKAGPAPVTLQLFNATVRSTPTSFYQDLYHALIGAVAALNGLKGTLDALLGDQAPSMSELLQRLHDMGQWAYTTLRERGEDPAMTMEEPPEVSEVPDPSLDEPSNGAADAADVTLHAGGAIAGRRDAYRQLAAIADYLARTEPHSPAPYLLHRIVQWRDLPLPALLMELSRGRRDVAAIFELLGLPEGE